VEQPFISCAINFPGAVLGPTSRADLNSAVRAEEAKGLSAHADDLLLHFSWLLR